MCCMSTNKAKENIRIAKEYYEKNYPTGATLTQVELDLNNVLKDYFRYYELNMSNSKNKYNSAVKKHREKWYILETLEKIFLATKTTSGVLELNKFDDAKLVKKFLFVVDKEAYMSYDQNDELSF